MSSEMKTTATANGGKPALVPKLRFPEFQDSAGWDVDELAKVADFVNAKIPIERVALENFVSTENVLPNFGGIARASKLPKTGSVTRYRQHDTLVSNIRPYLKKVWVADKEGGASNDVIVIRTKQRLLPQYLPALLKNDAFIDYVMTGAKGVKMPRGDLGSMKEYPTFYPTKPEQQKIADCLTSVDELIAAQAGYVDALKTHKKGLMQQLFPREGETHPRLRFLEFRDAGDWGVEYLGDICQPQQWTTISATDLVDHGYPVYGANGFIGYYTDFNHEYETVAVTCRGSTCGEVTLIPPKSYITGNSMCLDAIDADQYSYHFVYQLLKHRGFDDIISGSAQPQIVGNAIKRLRIALPKKGEQQRIADCLTSLDDLIAAQSQKLDALKTHKKGLMQQLFPVLEEVDA
jgi:type I restriction enzyme, S subunit